MELESILLDLSEYECDEIVTASLDLLTKMYYFEEELFNKAKKVLTALQLKCMHVISCHRVNC